MSVVRLLLARRLEPLKHIMYSTDQAIAAISGLTLGPEHRLCKADVEDFFMKANHGQMLALIRADPETSKQERVVEFLLFNQLVRFDRKVYRVKVGSGMGSQLSSDLCDLCFYLLVEQSLLRPCILHAYGISAWIRYRDDILFVVNCQQMLADFSKNMSFLLSFLSTFVRVCEVSITSP